MKYGIVRGAPATASVPGSESDEDTSNHCSSSSATLYSVTTNCWSYYNHNYAESARQGVYVIHHPRLSRGADQASLWIPRGSSTDKTHPKGSSANKTRLKLPKLVVESFYR